MALATARRGSRALSLYLALLLGAVWLLAGCGQKESPAAQSAPPTSTETVQPTTPPTPTATEPAPTETVIAKQSEEEARRQDAQMYADAYGITLEEALKRLELADEIGPLGATLGASEPETFGGAYLQNEPEFRYVVLFTRDGEETIRPYIEGTSYEDLVEVREVQYSYRELQDAQAAASDILREIGASVSSSVSVMDNRVELYVFDGGRVDALLAEAGLVLPEPVVYVEGGEGEVPPEYDPTPVPGVYFAQLKPQLGPMAHMEALLVGELALVDGCIVVEAGSGVTNGYTLPIWPPDHKLRVEGDVIEILNAGDQVVARVGEKINMGGGDTGQNADQISENLRYPIPSECQGSYWAVGDTYPLGTGPGASD